MGRTYYDDNYGVVDIEDEDDLAWIKSVNKQSRRKKCKGCGRMVKLLPQYDVCDSCADKRERGFDF